MLEQLEDKLMPCVSTQRILYVSIAEWIKGKIVLHLRKHEDSVSSLEDGKFGMTLHICIGPRLLETASQQPSIENKVFCLSVSACRADAHFQSLVILSHMYVWHALRTGFILTKQLFTIASFN